MIRNIGLTNYKCFDELDIRLSNLTLITGENGAGKSSIIQSLLLLRQSQYDKNIDLKNKVRFDGDLADLVNANSCRCAYTDQEDIVIAIDDDCLDEELTVTIKDATDEQTEKACEPSGNLTEATQRMALFREDFAYLYADRQDPRRRYERGRESTTDSRLGDKHGHLTAFRLQLENPEAHLHPSAQTRMGEFLARAAEAGIQIITETHSDHLLNGVRVAVKKQLAAAGHIAIHYIYKDEDNKHHRDRDIKLQADGTLNDWPTGFFDEWEKAFGQLL